MSKNIQFSHNAPSHQFLHYFGFHIALMNRGYEGKPCELQEGIGRHWEIYDCISKFENLPQAENYLQYYYKEQLENYSARLSKIEWSFSTIFKQTFFGFGFFSELKTKIEELKTIKARCEKLLANPMAHTPIKRLPEYISVPKYLIGEQDYYYYPSLVGSRLVVRKLQLVYRTIQKTKHESYTHSFDYKFCDVDNKKFTLNYSFLSLFQFDGSKWGSELGFDMLFLSEEEATNYVANFYADELAKIS